MRDTALLSLHFAAKSFLEQAGMDSEHWDPVEGRRDQTLPLRASKSSRREQKVAEFWRGRCCPQREEEHPCPAQLQHFLTLLGSCGQPGLFIFKEAILGH